MIVVTPLDPKIQEMLDRIKPKLLVPVYTKHPELFRNSADEVHDQKRCRSACVKSLNPRKFIA